MALTTLTKTDGLDMGSAYLTAKKYIRLALREDFGLSPPAADHAIELAGIEAIFREHPESAAHTSNEAWAQYAHQVYRKRRGGVPGSHQAVTTRVMIRDGKILRVKTSTGLSPYKVAAHKAGSSLKPPKQAKRP